MRTGSSGIDRVFPGSCNRLIDDPAGISCQIACQIFRQLGYESFAGFYGSPGIVGGDEEV